MFAIAPYYVEVLDSQKQPLDLWNIGANKTLHGFLKTYYSSMKGVPVSSTAGLGKAFVVRDVFKAAPETVAGLYQTGIFGFESEIFDTTSKKVSHKRKKTEADMLPFPFSIYLPQNVRPPFRKKGLMLLSRFSTSGIRGTIVPHLKAHFQSSFPGLTLSIERVLPDSVLKAILHEGSVKQIRLVKHALPADYANVLSAKDQKKMHSIELVYRPKRRTAFTDVNWLIQLFEGRKNTNSVFTIPAFEPENIKVSLVKGGKTRTVDVGNPGRVSSNVDISHVAAGPSGHIDPQDWLNEADDLAQDIFKTWGAGKVVWTSKVS